MYSLFDNLQKHGAIPTKRGVHEDTLKVLRSEGILFDLVDNNMLKYTCNLIEMKVN